eukprot:2433268-Rhodomonas_salina.1
MLLNTGTKRATDRCVGGRAVEREHQVGGPRRHSGTRRQKHPGVRRLGGTRPRPPPPPKNP